MFASRKRVSEVSKPVSGFLPGPNNPVIAPGLQTTAPSADNLQKLEIAKKLASQINAAKNLGGEQPDKTQQVAAAILRGDMATPQISVCIINSAFYPSGVGKSPCMVTWVTWPRHRSRSLRFLVKYYFRKMYLENRVTVWQKYDK